MGLPLAPIAIEEYPPTMSPLSMVVLVDVVQVGLLQAAILRSKFPASKWLMMGLPLVPIAIDV